MNEGGEGTELIGEAPGRARWPGLAQDGSQDSVWKSEGPGPRPALQGDPNMGFLLILTKNHKHPTSHLLLITQVIGFEALVEVTGL